MYIDQSSSNVFKNTMSVALRVLRDNTERVRTLQEEKSKEHTQRLATLKDSMTRGIVPLVYIQESKERPSFLWSDLVELGYAKVDIKNYILNEDAPCGVEVIVSHSDVIEEDLLPEGESVMPGEVYTLGKGNLFESKMVEVDIEREKDRNIIVQIREAIDVNGKRPIVFKDGNTTLLTESELVKIDTLYNKIEKPVNRVEFVNEISETPSAIIKYI